MAGTIRISIYENHTLSVPIRTRNSDKNRQQTSILLVPSQTSPPWAHLLQILECPVLFLMHAQKKFTIELS